MDHILEELKNLSLEQSLTLLAILKKRIEQTIDSEVTANLDESNRLQTILTKYNENN